MERVTHELRAAIQQSDHESVRKKFDELKKMNLLKVRSAKLLELIGKGSGVNVCFSVYGYLPKSISRDVKPIRYVLFFSF